MRTILILLVSLTGVAAASPDRQCEQFNIAAPTLELAQQARISYASCLASCRLDGVVLTSDIEASRTALEAAVAPIVATLDEVISQGDPKTQIMADHIKANLYVGMTVRLRNAGPPLDARVAASANRWLQLADRSYADIGQVAMQHPNVRANPVVALAVDNSARQHALTRAAVVGSR